MDQLKLKFFLIFFFLTAASGLFCQKQLTQAWQYQLIKSEKIGEPIKSWYLFGGPRLEKGPKIIIQNEKVKWLNQNISKTVSLPDGYLKTIFSKNGQYFGIISLNEPPKSRDRNKIFKLEVYSAPAKKLYTLFRKQYFDDSFPSVTISNKNGSVVMGQNTTGKLWFYSQNGVLIKELVLFTDATYDLERILHFDLNEDGTRLAVAASKRGASPLGSSAIKPSGEPHLFLFEQNGGEIWRYNLPEFNVSQTAISADGSHIIVNNYTIDVQGQLKKKSLLFNNAGERINSFDILFKYAEFSPDSKYLIIAENNVANVIEVSSGAIIWRTNISRKQGMITAARLSNAAEYAILLVANNEFKDGQFMFTNCRVKVLDRTGKLFQEIELKDETFEKPQLHFTPDHSYITIGFKNSYRIYEAIQ